MDDNTKVVGVYAYSTPGKVFLYEDGCVVAASEELINTYLGMLTDSIPRMKVSKLRFGEIYDGLQNGAVYAFDRQSYARFYTLARRAGVDDLRGFPDDPGDELKLMKVKFDKQ